MVDHAMGTPLPAACRRWFDRVHGEVCLSSLAAAVSETPEFNRLDGVRQLGACCIVYPSATHTRREHSIGVAYLAGVLGRHLQSQLLSRASSVDACDLVDARDIACLEVAGLMHDIGHGPFSHLFEAHVREVCDPTWHHEAMSCNIVRSVLTRLGVCAEDVAFVQVLISGLDETDEWPEERVGRPPSKRFLADVVHNRACGIDVDRLDYLLRDSLAVFGATHSIDATRIVQAARVRDDLLVFDRRVALSLEHIYELRTRLHRQVYQHREVLVVEHLLRDLLRARGTAWLRSYLDDPSRYATFTDACVLAHMTPTQSTRLYHRPRMQRIVDVSMITQPACGTCGGATRIPDRFCPHCGVSTDGRPWVAAASATVRIPPAVALDGPTMTRAWRARCGRDDVHVFVCDVFRGTPVVTRDAQGHAWRDYAAMSLVRFDETLAEGVPESATWMAGHSRTAYCYVDALDALSQNEVARLTDTALETLKYRQASH